MQAILELHPELKAILDKVVTHLVTQRARAMTPQDEGCAYRGENGTMCAVGCLIPDDIYSPDIESLGVQGLLDYPDDHSTAEVRTHLNALAPSVRSDALSSFLRRLQRFHDSNNRERRDDYVNILGKGGDDDTLRANMLEILDSVLHHYWEAPWGANYAAA